MNKGVVGFEFVMDKDQVFFIFRDGTITNSTAIICVRYTHFVCEVMNINSYILVILWFSNLQQPLKPIFLSICCNLYDHILC